MNNRLPSRKGRPKKAPITADADEGMVVIDLGRHTPVETERTYIFQVSGTGRTGSLSCSEKAKSQTVTVPLTEARGLAEKLISALVKAARWRGAAENALDRTIR